MTPRRYRSVVRAKGTERTRSSIVEAAISLYARQGVVATSWEDLASEAGLSTATVYRHFPSLADLIPACAKASFDVTHIPTMDEVEGRFASIDSVEGKLRILIEDTLECYAKADAWLTAAYRDRAVVSAMREVVDRQRLALETLIKGALGRRATPNAVQVLLALIDFPFWKSLQEAHLPSHQVPKVVRELVMSSIGRGG